MIDVSGFDVDVDRGLIDVGTFDVDVDVGLIDVETFDVDVDVGLIDVETFDVHSVACDKMSLRRRYGWVSVKCTQ